MKKHLISAAVAAAVAVPAVAQVTVGGTIDAAYVNKTQAIPISNVSAFTATGTQTVTSLATKRVTAVDNSFWSSSNINFKGSEDLGGGIKASFHVEGGVNTDTGSANLADRVSQLAVSGAFGTVTLGRGSTAMNDFRTSAGHGVGNFANLGGGTSSRPNNAINYITPSFNGISARVTMAPGENPGDADKNGDYTAASVSYAVGNFSFAIAQATEHQKRSTSGGRAFSFNSVGNSANTVSAGILVSSFLGTATVNTTTGVFTFPFGITATNDNTFNMVPLTLSTDGKIRDSIVTAGYDFGIARVRVQHLRTKSSGDIARSNGRQVRDETVNAVTLIAPLGATTLSVNYQDHDRTKNQRGSSSTYALGAARSTDESKVVNLGASYALSKRTAAYLVYQKTDNGILGELNSGVAGKDSTVTAIGLRHSF